VSLDAGAKLQPVAQVFLLSLGSLPVEKCSWNIPPKHTGNARQDEFNFQYEILRYCAMPGTSDDVLRLNGTFNYESAESAAALYYCTITEGQQRAFVQRRLEQIKAAEADATLAHKMVAGPDADGDWVPNSSDKCANTPIWTPVDDSGCPLAFSPGRSCDAVKRALDNTGLVFNSNCPASAGFMPPVTVAVAAYWKNAPEKGLYIYVQDIPPQAAGCEAWYKVEVRSTKAGQVVDHFSIGFPYSQASHSGSIVPAIPAPYVELRAVPTAPGNVGRLGALAAARESGTIDRVVWRVQAVSGVAAHGPWSGWREFIPQDCNAVGFTCVR
jgi:hypothetical protein